MAVVATGQASRHADWKDQVAEACLSLPVVVLEGLVPRPPWPTGLSAALVADRMYYAAEALSEQAVLRGLRVRF